MTKKNTAQDAVNEFDGYLGLAGEAYKKALTALRRINAKAKTLDDADLFVFTTENKPARDKLAKFIGVHDNQVVPAHEAVKAAVAEGDPVKTQKEAGNLIDGLEALAAISPDLKEKFEAYEARLTAVETTVGNLKTNDTKQDARLDHLEAYLEDATAGKGFTPYVRHGATPAAPEPVAAPTPTTPLPAVPQAQQPITDAESLAGATGADYVEPEKKGFFATLRERFASGTGRQSNTEGQELPRPSQYFGTTNNPATAGGAH